MPELLRARAWTNWKARALTGVMFPLLAVCTIFCGQILLGDQGERKHEQSPKQHPLWVTDLRTAGCPSAVRSLPNVRLAFLTEDLLLVTFWGVQSREDLPLSPNRQLFLHAMVFDVPNGAIRSKVNWPFSESEWFALFPGDGGRFLFRLGKKLYLSTADLTTLKEFELPSSGKPGEDWTVKESASRKTLIVENTFLDGFETKRMDSVTVERGLQHYSYRSPRRRRVYYALNTSDLTERARWEDIHPFKSASDNSLAVAGWPEDDWPLGDQIYINAIGKSLWRAIYHRPLKMFPGHPTLLSDQLLVVAGDGVKLLSTNGKVLFADRRFSRNDLIGPDPLIAQDASRFAVVVTKERTPFLSDFSFDVSSRLIVYDVESRTRVYDFALQHPVHWAMDWLGQHAGLSPSGSHLAYTSDGKIEVYELPNLPSLPPEASPN